MKHLRCAHLVPDCAAEFAGADEAEVIVKYVPHASQAHRDPINMLDLVNAISDHPAVAA